MGREQYLERLALGRSPYQSGPATTNNQGNTQPQESQPTEIPNNTRVSLQQYDSKGRPTNPTTEARNAKLRHASNEVLALVGVVERKDSADAQMQLDTTLRRTAREHLLILEDNRGNEWSAGLDVLSWFALWWPTALVRRIQVGIYPTDLSFADILSLEASTILGNGWRGLLLGLLPGTGVAILHKVLWQLSALLAEETIGYLQNLIVASNLRRRTAKRLIRSLTLLMDLLYVLLDILLLPLETYALARQLSLAPPTTPWRPLLTTHLPSLFRATFATAAPTGPTTTSQASTLARLTTSAAPHLLSYNLLTRDPSPSAPAFSDITSYRLPPISSHGETPSTQSQWPNPPPSPYDPFAAILRQTRRIRQKFLRAVGWNMHEQQRPGATHGWETDAQIVAREDSAEYHVGDLQLVTHRSTSLARLPATWLGMRTDMFLLRLLMLPVESAAMRKVAEFYISSGMPLAKGVGAVGDSQMMGSTIPGLWSFVTGRAGRGGYGVVVRRLSQLGLGIALTLGVEVLLFGVVYGLARRDGVANFGWKRLYRDGNEGMVVEEEEEEDLVGQDEGRVAVVGN